MHVWYIAYICNYIDYMYHKKLNYKHITIFSLLYYLTETRYVSLLLRIDGVGLMSDSIAEDTQISV